jgi:hypothetical protein
MYCFDQYGRTIYLLIIWIDQTKNDSFEKLVKPTFFFQNNAI